MRSLLFVFLCPLLALAEDKLELNPVGFLRADYFAYTPLNDQGQSVLNAHLRNISDAPLKLEIRPLNYLSSFIVMGLPAKNVDVNGDFDVWGPEHTELSIEHARLKVSGFGEDGQIPFWPQRDGITLLRDEGYARKIAFTQGWLGDSKIPVGTRHLVIDATTVLKVSSPELKPEAVQPDKPIIFSAPVKIYAPGCRLVPYSPAKEVAQLAGKPGTDLRSGLTLEVEAPTHAVEGRDLEVTYLVGNVGKQTIWIEQSSLVPSQISCEIHAMGSKLDSVSGEDLEILDSLSPSRQPVALNPGEYLTYRRVFLADSPKLRKGTQYGFIFSLKPTWYPTSDIKPENRKKSDLDASVTFRLN